MKHFLSVFCIFFSLALMPVGVVGTSTGVSAVIPVDVISVEMKPEVITKGAACLFVVTSSEQVRTMTGKLFGKKVFFNPDSSRTKWYGLGGVSLDTKPGKYPLEVSALTSKGSRLNQRVLVKVVIAPIPKGGIRVADEFLHPNEERRQQSKTDAEFKRIAFGTETLDQLWKGSFKSPIGTEVISRFGRARTFNGTAKRIHKGIDYRASEGTSIKATNSGRVILAKSMFYDGNMVAIDHGQGLISMYLHLSRIKVKEGDLVKSGQEVGLSGKTGRASGPHLHFQVKWERIDIDPVRLISLELPSNLSK